MLYRVASVLILLFAAGHTLGFQKTDPNWGVDSLIGSLRGVQFETQGFTRSYLDFFVGFGLFASVFLLFAGVLAWQLGSCLPDVLARLKGAAWSLALCFVAITILCLRYFFLTPIIFSAVISLVLIAAARSIKAARP